MNACNNLNATKQDDLVEMISQVFADYDEGKLTNDCAFFAADGVTNIGYVRIGLFQNLSSLRDSNCYDHLYRFIAGLTV